MNIHTLNRTSEQIYPHGLLAAHECFDRNQTETFKALRSIIMLSMQCLDIMLRNGRIQGGNDRDSLVQDVDPYIENLMNMVRQGTTQQDWR